MINKHYLVKCHCAAIRQVSRKITAVYDDMLAPVALTLAQFSLIRRLDRGGSMSISDLAEVMELERTSLGRNLKPLKRDGLVRTQVNESDTRERIVSLTANGKKKLGAAVPLWEAAQASVEKRFGKARIKLMHQLIDEIESISEGKSLT